MLNLVQTEFLKLRRRKFVWLMLLAALLMPLVAIFYFGALSTIEIMPMQFYKWTALSYTPWIILPFVLGMLCTMLMYDENQNDMLKELWIIPVSKMGYFFSKFMIVLVYSLCFMLLTAVSSILAGVLPGMIVFTNDSVSFLLIKCLEVGVLTPFAMLPVLAVAASQKGYILPVCVTIVYTFLGFILLMVNMYIHPLSSTTAIIMRNIPGVVMEEPVHLGKAFLCIGIWGIASTIWARIALSKGK
ncbi:ABC transporter permease [Mahella sp.]|uniref:ABC transporter permease n=1 Tax=Mahella sp. TaxID=2798721 RepID=UPI0025BBCC8F|nr:ABC transporter permease [Mahella sp.]MBZ4665681.1 putative transporter, permease protein [Mahella sp.]MDK2992263.1 bacitracin transport system permease protein [Clostridiales bacterium]